MYKFVKQKAVTLGPNKYTLVANKSPAPNFAQQVLVQKVERRGKMRGQNAFERSCFVVRHVISLNKNCIFRFDSRPKI
jgi:hypothetical protein